MSARSLKELFFLFFSFLISLAVCLLSGCFYTWLKLGKRFGKSYKICDNGAATDTQFIMFSVHAENAGMKNITIIIYYKLSAK